MEPLKRAVTEKTPGGSTMRRVAVPFDCKTAVPIDAAPSRKVTKPAVTGAPAAVTVAVRTQTA